MANKSVIEYPSVSDVLGTDVLYYIRGTGSDRDKKITVETLFGNLSVPFIQSYSGENETSFKVIRNGQTLIENSTTQLKFPSATQAVAGGQALLIGNVGFFQRTDAGSYTTLSTSKIFEIDAKLHTGGLSTRSLTVTKEGVSDDSPVTVGLFLAKKATTDTPAITGFGTQLFFSMIQNTGVTTGQGALEFLMDGAENSHVFEVSTYRSGARIRGLRVKGNVVQSFGRAGSVRRLSGVVDGSNDVIKPTDSIIYLKHTSNDVPFEIENSGWIDGQIVEVFNNTNYRAKLFIEGVTLYSFNLDGIFNASGNPTGLTLVYDAVLNTFFANIPSV